MARLAQADLADLNQTFEERTPVELLQWAKEIFGDRVAAISAMQEAGNVVCHHIHTAAVDIPILFVDTGVMFQETLDTRDRLSEAYGLDIKTLKPDMTMQEQTDEHGVLYLTQEGQLQCCHMRKVEPLQKVSGDYDAFVGSLRRSEGGRRAECPILMVDIPTNTLRINPLAMMDDDQLHDYIKENEVIVNPLHAQGFTTIGCNRCTTPVLPSEPKRAGRWRHLGPWAVYCGINPTDRDPANSPAIDLPQTLVDRILGRMTDYMI